MQRITGTSESLPKAYTSPYEFTGALYSSVSGAVHNGLAFGGKWSSVAIGFDSALVARTSTETRSLNTAFAQRIIAF